MWQVIFRKHENPNPKFAEEFFVVDIWIFYQQLTQVAWIQANHPRFEFMSTLKRLDQTHDVAKHAPPPYSFEMTPSLIYFNSGNRPCDSIYLITCAAASWGVILSL